MIYKMLLLLLLTGCYTVLINPYGGKTKVVKKKEVIQTEEILPIVQKHYVHYPQYYNRYDTNNYPFYTSTNHSYYDPQIYIVSEPSEPTSQQKQSTNNIPQRHIEPTHADKKNVWQKRINPRNRKPPTPTRREKDGE